MIPGISTQYGLMSPLRSQAANLASGQIISCNFTSHVMSARMMSAINREELSADMLESSIYQNYQQRRDEYYTWFLGHRAGRDLTVQSSLPDSALRILDRLRRGSQDTTTEIDQQDV